MTTRKAPENVDENPKKKARVVGDNRVTVFSVDTVSFCSLPTDCKVNVFSFLPPEDMNTAACCNKDCCEVRANESLDQKRTGTIVWTYRTTTRSFCNKLQESQDKFTGNMTCLKVEGLERYPNNEGMNLSDMHDLLDGVRLEGVTSLDCSCVNPSRAAVSSPLYALGILLPNLHEVDLSNNVNDCFDMTLHLMVECSANLRKITWNGYHDMSLCGFDFMRATNLTHLCVHRIMFHGSFVEFAADLKPYYLLMRCPNLECLSMKGATVLAEYEERESLPQPLPQEVIIKMVRRHPTLRWLKSDLTADNVAMLKRERPEITFVSE